jgi:alpha-tubulin suppressor-like RCC1 family protein
VNRPSGLLRVALTIAVLALAGASGSALTAPSVSAGGPIPLTGVVRISAGTDHACVTLEDRTARCWGDNAHGQLGDGTTQERHTAAVVRNPAGTGPLRGVVDISASHHVTCAVLRSGQARCWGANDRGQLGDGTTTERHLPVAVSNRKGTGPLIDVIAISSGGVQTCALLASTQVRCWGYGGYGLGNGSSEDRSRPVVVRTKEGGKPLTGVVGIGASSTMCGRLASDRMRCWGYDGNGQAGDGKDGAIVKWFPVSVRKPAGQPGPLADVRGIGVSGHVCAHVKGGRALCWGPQYFGILGNGSTDGERHRPVVVRNETGTGSLRDVAQIASRYRNTCARLANRQAVCWGSNEEGQLGDGSRYPESALPVRVMAAAGTPLTGIARVAVGSMFTCAALRDRTARCWGDNGSGRLGNDTTSDSSYPVTVLQ